MVSVPTPIPESWVSGVKKIFRGSTGDVLWKVGVSLTVVLLGILLLAGGGVVGAVIGGLLITTLLDDDVRETVKDVWNRDFWRFKV